MYKVNCKCSESCAVSVDKLIGLYAERRAEIYHAYESWELGAGSLEERDARLLALEEEKKRVVGACRCDYEE
jgi:hypothetical protein